jgi:hypothetical protein
LSKPLPSAVARTSIRPGNSLVQLDRIDVVGARASFHARGFANCSCALPLTAAVECLDVVLRDASLLFDSTPRRACAGGSSGPSTCAVVVKS